VVAAPPPAAPVYRPRQSSSNGPVIAGVGCAVVLVLALLIFAIVVAASEDDADGDPPAYPTAAPTFSRSPSPTTGTRLPLAFNGVWEGKGFQPSAPAQDRTWNVRFTLLGGGTTGLVYYESATYTCRGTLTLQPGVTERRATYKINIYTGECVSGYVTFIYLNSSTLRFEERENITDATYLASGTVTK